MVSGSNAMYLENYEKTGAELIFGSGSFVAPRTIEVSLNDGGKRQLRGTNVIISTGTHAMLPKSPALLSPTPLLTSRRSNSKKFPSTFSSSVEAMWASNCRKRCVASEPR